MYDIIGDIHGHAEALKALLAKMGYSRRNKGFAHPTRQAIFVGDFIDRGPQIAEVLTIVRTMVDSGAAHAVMGNHEFNAIAFHTWNFGKNYFREHCKKNVGQHCATLDQVPDILDWVEWFKSLPVTFDLETIRVVHACWDEKDIEVLHRGLDRLGRFTPEFLREALPDDKSGELYLAVEHVLKGKERRLPEGLSYRDKDGHERKTVRVRWFESPVGKRWRDYAFGAEVDFPDDEVPLETLDAPYPPDAPPVFFGHYWLKAERPEILAPNVACVDYSVAKEGLLVAYRWKGEAKLTTSHFEYTDAVP